MSIHAFFFFYTEGSPTDRRRATRIPSRSLRGWTKRVFMRASGGVPVMRLALMRRKQGSKQRRETGSQDHNGGSAQRPPTQVISRALFPALSSSATLRLGSHPDSVPEAESLVRLCGPTKRPTAVLRRL